MLSAVNCTVAHDVMMPFAFRMPTERPKWDPSKRRKGREKSHAVKSHSRENAHTERKERIRRKRERGDFLPLPSLPFFLQTKAKDFDRWLLLQRETITSFFLPSFWTGFLHVWHQRPDGKIFQDFLQLLTDLVLSFHKTMMKRLAQKC